MVVVAVVRVPLMVGTGRRRKKRWKEEGRKGSDRRLPRKEAQEKETSGRQSGGKESSQARRGG